MRRFPVAALPFLAMLLVEPALAETPAGAAARLDAWLDEFPDLGPGYAVVVVDSDGVLLNRTDGIRNTATGDPLTEDTPMYIASQTKAYVGLLASVLDARGVLSLEDTIADHWPGIELPGGADPAAYTLRDLLTHQVPIEVGFITTLEAYVTNIDADDYPRLIEEYGTAREQGFDYDNLGYNLYSAILASATGKDWRTWLDEVLFHPARMTRTSARASSFDTGELAWGHIWQGPQQGWSAVPPKTDGMMQSAGGLYTSTSDMATWLQLQLRRDADVAGIRRAMIETAQTDYVATGMEDRRNPYELVCTGYALGWNICDFDGNELYVHGGTYTGSRSLMAFSHELGVGIAVFSNSDNMTGWFTSRTVSMYLQFLVDDEDADSWARQRIGQYPQRVADFIEHRQNQQQEMLGEARWQGWAWQPSGSDLEPYTGRWTTGEPYLDIEIRLVGGMLTMHWGDARMPLKPAARDLFGAQSAPYDRIESFVFERATDDSIRGLVWQDRRYTRPPAKAASPAGTR